MCIVELYIADCDCTSHATLAQKFRHNRNRRRGKGGGERGGVVVDEIENGASQQSKNIKNNFNSTR